MFYIVNTLGTDSADCRGSNVYDGFVVAHSHSKFENGVNILNGEKSPIDAFSTGTLSVESVYVA